MKICNWTYLYDCKNGFSILPDTKKEFPSFLVKYYSINDKNVDVLTKAKFYFPHSLIPNDPFDSCIQLIDLNRFTKNQLISFYDRHKDYLLQDRRLNYRDIKKYINREYSSNKLELLKNTLTFYWNFIFQDYGILSLASKDNSLLMWSYYTNHEGFALKFTDIKFNEKTFGTFPINYQEKYEVVFPDTIDIKKEYLLYLTNIKSNLWIHEDEWRMILNRPNMSVPDYTDNSFFV